MEKGEQSEQTEKSGQSNVEGQSNVDGQTAGAAADSVGPMEIDKKPSSQYLEGLETRFAQLCEVNLCLDEKTSAQALQLFKENKSLLISTIGTVGTGTVEEAERLWSACLLFAVKRLANGTSIKDDKMEANPLVGFTLSQILNVNKLSLLEFFKEVPQVLVKAGPKLKATYGDDWEKRLMIKEVQADFYYLTVLFNYYRRVYQNLFSSVEDSRGGATSALSSGTNGGSGPSVHMRFGWMLFLVLRMHVLGRFVDLVTYINGLLAVVIILILHMPPSLRKFDFEDELFFKVRGADGNVKVIASLCALYHDASEEDVSRMVEKASNMIGDLFRKSSGFRTRSHAEQLGGIETEGLQYFEGLMDERSVSSNLRILEKDYEGAYHSRGEVDERMFINGDENVIVPLSSGGTPTSSGVKRKWDTLSFHNQAATMSTGACPPSPSSPFSSPAKSNSGVGNCRMPPPTPVSVTMSLVKWLRTFISPLSPEPSSELQQFLRACDRDISAEVTHRVKVLFEAIFSIDETNKSRASQGTALLDSAWVEKRRLEATKLYYRVLTAMCRAESQRLANKNLAALLTNDRFHRCMMACSAELVLYTHKTVTMTFPAVLEPTGITAFDFSKVIESFVRHEETLPRELKRHLNSMEQQILESMAWEKGSSMYNSLIVAKPQLAPVINHLGLLAEPMPSLDNLTQHILQLPENARREPDPAVEGAATPSSPPKAATLPSCVNGTSAHANGVGDHTANLLPTVKERPSAFSAFSSPMKCRPQPPLQSVFASPQRPGPLGGGETCAETVINVFLLKVLKLAAVRTKDLCERLHQPNQVWEQVYRTMKHLVEKETILFFNRHIDQMILCTIYGVCRVNKANVTFKKCIEHYNKQPQCKRQVFCNVLLDLSPVRGEGGKTRSQEVGDIIKFYNQIFVPAAKQYLVQLGESVAIPAPPNTRLGDEDKHDKDGSGPGSPRPSIPAVPDMSPKKVSASHNVYVSPLRSTKMDTIMSPHTRSLYACVGESTHAYQSPSKDLTAINNRLNNRRLGKLDFNGTALVSDSLVAGSLYPCTRSANHHSVRLTADSVLRGQSQPSWTMVAPLPPSPMKRPRSDR